MELDSNAIWQQTKLLTTTQSRLMQRTLQQQDLNFKLQNSMFGLIKTGLTMIS